MFKCIKKLSGTKFICFLNHTFNNGKIFKDLLLTFDVLGSAFGASRAITHALEFTLAGKAYVIRREE